MPALRLGLSGSVLPLQRGLIQWALHSRLYLPASRLILPLSSPLEQLLQDA